MSFLGCLNELSKKIDKDNTWLYRDDGLSVFKNHNDCQNDKVRKEMIALFKQHHLNLEIKSNLKIVDYLDITFDLTTILFKPYNKFNGIPRYVNTKSNNPPSILKKKKLKSVSKRILSNSCNEQTFNAAAPFHNILDKCGYSEKLTFEKEQYTHERRNRGRNIIWYNPSFSKNVKTYIAKQSFHLLDKYFGKNHKNHKIFNRNNVKINYSCIDNMTNLISSNNKKVTNSDNQTNGKTCNCRNKSNCPLDNKCLADKIIYKAQVKTNDGINELSIKAYFGISETEFKSRYNNHTMSFRNRTHENDAEL